VIRLSLAEIAEIVGGVVMAGSGDRPAPGSVIVTGRVVTDARECDAGSLYVARVGEHADGLDYVPQAASGGCVAVLATRPAGDLPTVLVPDVQAAFAALAVGVLGRLPDLEVVAITGSSGKTSTKDLLAQVLGGHRPTVATERSFNGEVGVPLTVLRADRSTRYLITEMGARGVGHIRYLTGIARPQVAVVLNVGSAHLGEFGSVAAIASAKSELVAALGPAGLAVLNGDDPLVRQMAASTVGRVALVGRCADADVRAENVRVDADARACFTLSAAGTRARVRLALHGEHHVANALAVVAVALEAGMPLPEIVAAIEAAPAASRWRMAVTDRPDGVRVVNDAYNANPESMLAALRALAAMGTGRRTWAVIGQMRELGTRSAAEHEAVGRSAVRLGIDRLVAVGPGAEPVHAGALAAGAQEGCSVHLPDTERARVLLTDQLRPGDVVLLKSSRDAGLRYLGDRLSSVGSGAAAEVGSARTGEQVS
jgi:UDP-N-acetylmuramoyl-tripeptide--D-alanyl-D-alanine ligase